MKQNPLEYSDDFEIEGLVAAHLPPYPGYAVTVDGSVWSFWKTKNGRVAYIDSDRPRKLTQDRSGKYLRVGVTDENGKHVIRRVHVLVLLGFSGIRPDGMESRHLDGDVTNNQISNLKYGTRVENHEDKERHGRVPRGESHVNSRLNTDNVIQARKLWKTGVTSVELAAQFGVDRRTVHRAVTGETWKQLDAVEAPWKPGRW